MVQIWYLSLEHWEYLCQRWPTLEWIGHHVLMFSLKMTHQVEAVLQEPAELRWKPVYTESADSVMVSSLECGNQPIKLEFQFITFTFAQCINLFCIWVKQQGRLATRLGEGQLWNHMMCWWSSYLYSHWNANRVHNVYDCCQWGR